MEPRVLVYLPGRQHAYQLVCALQEGGQLAKFITSAWFKPASFPYNLRNLLPSKLRESLESQLKRRYYEGVDENYVEQFPFFELLRKALDGVPGLSQRELGVYLGNRIHDFYVSRRIDGLKPDMVVGYETSSLRGFKRARSRNITTILDLSQVHYRFINEVRRQYREYDTTFDSKISNRLDRIKEQELGLSDYIISLSDLVKSSLINYGISEGKIYRANLGFDPGKFSIKGNYRRNGIFRILYAGAITRRKGISLLLEAFKQLRLKDSQLLLIGGMTDDSDFLQEYKGMYKHIPYVNHEQLASYYQDADVFVLPSYLDSWGMVVTEAMACGTPVIVSDNTGAKEAVLDGVNGFIIPVGDVDEIKDKILFFYNSRDKLESFGRNARKRAENYTWEKYRMRIREILSEIWEKRKHEGRSYKERS